MLLFDPPEDGPNKGRDVLRAAAAPISQFGPAGSLKRAIFGLLQQLTPERARYATFARENAGKAKQTETWYGVKHRGRGCKRHCTVGPSSVASIPLAVSN